MISCKDVTNGRKLNVLVSTWITTYLMSQLRIWAVTSQRTIITNKSLENEVEIKLISIDSFAELFISLLKGINSGHYAKGFTIDLHGIHTRISGNGAIKFLSTNFLIPGAQNHIGLLPFLIIKDRLNFIPELFLTFVAKITSRVNDYIEDIRKAVLLLCAICLENVEVTSI